MDKAGEHRRALTHVGGSVQRFGNQADAARLAHALDVAPATENESDPARTTVHGFHTYPARMHPDTAARLVLAFVPPKGRVLDPFCGSGTVLVEALVHGFRPFGTDLNPLAVRLARCKTRPREPAELEAMVAQARDCASSADNRRKARAGATRRFPAEDVTLFEPHVLLELDSLRAAVEAMPESPARLDLSLVLSAVLVKLSNRRGDTSRGAVTRRTAAGFPAKLFVQKTEEWSERLAALGRKLPKPPPARAFVALDDATSLRSLPTGGVDAIITSPPYAGTYDYLEHHAVRLRWLGLDGSALARGELGSRPAYRRIAPRDARTAWSRELDQFFRAAAGVLPVGGPLIILMADSAVGSAVLRADEIVPEVARECGFTLIARASQARPHFHGPTIAAFRNRPRAEHAILLRKA